MYDYPHQQKLLGWDSNKKTPNVKDKKDFFTNLSKYWEVYP